MADTLPYTVYDVERDRGNRYAVYYHDFHGDREMFLVGAKDELDAYVQGQQALEKKKANMKTAIICATLALVALLTSAVAGCKISSDEYAANMGTCVKAGKSYVAESGGYSCRDVVVRRKTN